MDDLDRFIIGWLVLLAFVAFVQAWRRPSFRLVAWLLAAAVMDVIASDRG